MMSTNLTQVPNKLSGISTPCARRQRLLFSSAKSDIRVPHAVEVQQATQKCVARNLYYLVL